MIGTWVDASAPLSGKALQQAGIIGCMRYVGIGSASKRLTVTERDDLLGAGRIVLGIAESTATEADNGAVAGQRDAEAVLADPAAAGLPFVFMTNDKPGFITADVDYAAAYAHTLGVRAADYGFATFLLAVRAAGIPMSVRWQAGDPPNMTGTQGFAHFWQRQGTRGNGTDGPATPTLLVIGGVGCDPNNQLLEVPMTMAWSDQFPVPNLDATGKYTGDRTNPDGTVQTASVEDNLRFGNAATWWLVDAVKALGAQITALGATTQAEITAEQSALLAAIKTLPAPVVQQITADPTAVAQQLIAAGLPGDLVGALLAVLQKAAPPANPPAPTAPTGGTA